MTDHPTQADLTAFVEGKLPSADIDTVAEHLETCADCQRAVEEIEATSPSLVADLRNAGGTMNEPADAVARIIEAAEAIGQQTEQVDPHVDTRTNENAVADTHLGDDVPKSDRSNVPGRGVAAGVTIGSRFGNYEIEDEIARGGMGVVFKAHQLKPKRPVALKMILASRLASDDDVQRFRSEAQSAAKLEHPGIVPVYEVGEIDGQHFFSMGLVEGGTLSDLVKDGPLPPRRAAEIVRQVAEAVQYAHSRNVVHRDLKPGNVLLDAEGRPKVTDFGLAKNIEDDSGLTQTGQVMGTPSYMAPEQAAGRTDEIGPLADVYALGAILYFLVTAHPPFKGRHVGETIQQVLNQDASSPRGLNPAVDLDLATICLKCLEKDPAKRYASAAEIGYELARYSRGEVLEARPIGRVQRLQRWCHRKPALAAAILAAALFFFIGTAGIAFFAYRSDLRRHAAEILLADKTELAQANAQLVLVEKRSRQHAQDREYEALTQLYRARLFELSDAKRANDFPRLATLVDRMRPAPQAPDFRGWEWYFFLRESQRSAGKVLAADAEYPGPLELHDDRDTLAILAADGSVEMWSLREGRRLRTSEPLTGARDLSWSPEGDCIALASFRQLKILAASDLTDIATFDTPFRYIRAVAWSPNGRLLAVAGHDLEYRHNGLVCLFDSQTGELRARLYPPASDLHTNGLAWHPEGRLLAGAHRGGRTTLWDASTATTVARLRSTSGAQSRSPTWSGNLLAVATGDQVNIYRGGVHLVKAIRTPSVVTHVEWVGDSLELLVATESRQVFRYILGSSEPVSHASLSSDPVRGLTVSEDHIIIAGGDLLLIPHSALATATGIPLGVREAMDVALSPDGAYIAVAVNSRSSMGCVIISRATRKIVQRISMNGEIAMNEAKGLDVEWSPSGGIIAVAEYQEPLVHVIDAHTGVATRTIRLETRVKDHTKTMAWSPDGRLLAISCEGIFSVWQTDRWDRLFSLRGPNSSLCWSPDGGLLGTGVGVFAVSDDHKTIERHSAEWVPISVGASLDGILGWSPNQLRALACDSGRWRDLAPVADDILSHGDIHPNGTRFAAPWRERQVGVWDTETWELLMSIPVTRRVRRVKWTRDGSALVILDASHVQIWESDMEHDAVRGVHGNQTD